eukprot:1158370-Pelagomonas_calceolata.AAC.6
MPLRTWVCRGGMQPAQSMFKTRKGLAAQRPGKEVTAFQPGSSLTHHTPYHQHLREAPQITPQRGALLPTNKGTCVHGPGDNISLEQSTTRAGKAAELCALQQCPGTQTNLGPLHFLKCHGRCLASDHLSHGQALVVYALDGSGLKKAICYIRA